MKIVKYISVITFVLISFIAQAQNEIDALRFSRHQVIGTARYMSMGGAFGALGADPSVLTQNPAGIALYRRNEFAFTLGLNNVKSSSEYMGNVSDLETFKTRLNTVSLISNKKSDNEDFSRVSFGMGYNKLINFDESYTFSGVVNGSSLLDVLVEQASGISPTNLENSANTALYAGPAYQTWLISPTDSLGSSYFHEIPNGDIAQRKTINTEGYLSEMTFNAGLNVNDKVFLGAAFAFPMLSFTERTTYTETPMLDSLELDHYTFKEKTVANGGGLNLKLGAIFQPTQWLRLGVAFHSPTRISIDQTKNTTFESSFLNGTETYKYSSNFVDYSYAVKTPAKYQLNTAFIFKKKGLLAIDYEYANYKNMMMKSTGFDDYSFEIENNTIDRIYQGTSSLKVGAEWRVVKSVALRGGMNYSQSPFQAGTTPAKAETISYSGGFGYRHEGFYIDLAYSQSSTSMAHYSYNNVEPAMLDKITGQTILTLGFRY